MVDSGLAARPLRLTPDKLTGLDPSALTDFGHLLETFVVAEVRKQSSWLDEPVAVGHWRTSDGAEVDLVIEHDDGIVLAFEVKASERAPGSDFRGLTQLRDALGTRLRSRRHPHHRNPLLHLRRPAPRHAHRQPLDPVTPTVAH